jgi:predicted alpha/beta hydrolase family esterase
MKQILIIHGGDSYSSYDEYFNDLKNSELQYDRLKPARRWKDEIIDSLPDADILTPTMPNSQNAQYEEWKIWFEKIIPFLGNDVRLIGHSLGAMFLAKYLNTSPLDVPIRQLILLAGGYDEEAEGYGQFRIESATGLEKSAIEIHLMHSEDDPVVPYEALSKYERDLPNAFVHRFTDRNHFLQPTFPELLELLKQD